MIKQTFDYVDGDVLLEGYVAYQEHNEKRPAVLVAHDWAGKNDLAKHSAEKLAHFGYVGIAIDMYGKGKLGVSKEEKQALIQPFLQDRKLVQQRILAGVAASKKLTMVDSNKIGAIGFCFGGLCVLDLARSGAHIAGVVSFHGLLNAPDSLVAPPIQAKVLVLHGYDDPMVPPEAVHSFCQEMSQAKVDWQMVMYGNVMHAFANPQANDPAFGTVYDKRAEARAWLATKNFFAEIF